MTPILRGRGAPAEFPNSLGNRMARALLLLFLACARALADNIDPSDVPPRIMREFRGVWVASVGNIDWPSKPGLDTAEQQRELVAILDRAAQMKLNAVILQVRPSCDALYESKYEPWSPYLTGTMGKPPTPYYDPLAFAVAQAHQRGLELHAWFNPYRAGLQNAKPAFSANHVSHVRPRVVRSYGQYLWLDPGDRSVVAYVADIVMDVVRRYDVDGVHFDDYFYPYKEKDRAGKPVDFPDEGTYWLYRKGGGTLAKSDWRRDNVNQLVRTVYSSIKREKPWVKFGISPFGIWRPGNPRQIVGLDAYEHLYADSRLWLRNRWVDYLAPQLYWPVDPAAQSYPVLLKWWLGEAENQRPVWPGCACEKVGKSWGAGEVLRQIDFSRKLSDTPGHVHWNMTALMRNPAGLTSALAERAYGEPALVPAFPWLERTAPGKPVVQMRQDDQGKTTLEWTNNSPGQDWLWSVQAKRGGKWQTEVFPDRQRAKIFKAGEPLPDAVAVTAFSRCGLAGPATLLVTKRELTFGRRVAFAEPPKITARNVGSAP